MPCTFNLHRLAANVKEGNHAAGGTPIEFKTTAIGDGVAIVCYVDRSTSAMLVVAGERFPTRTAMKLAGLLPSAADSFYRTVDPFRWRLFLLSVIVATPSVAFHQ